MDIATFGAGCFWCIEAILLNVPGITSIDVGYTGGHIDNPTYKMVCEGTTGHAEVVQIKFDNEILHRSKVIKHFLDDNPKISKTQKDFKSVYKKIKKNKKYFISIKDIVVLESLAADGISMPDELLSKFFFIISAYSPGILAGSIDFKILDNSSS